MRDGAPAAVLIDGYNILHAIPRFAPRGSDLTLARERFETWLAAAAAKRGVGECVLVWDGRGGSRKRSSGRVLVVYTAAGVTADERILDLCRGRFAARAASTWVVSSDRDVQGPARALGFEVLGAMAFYRRWNAVRGAAATGGGPDPVTSGDEDPGAKPRPSVPRKEVDELLDAFLDAEPDD